MALNDDLSKRVSELEKQLDSLSTENKGLREQLSKSKTVETVREGDMYFKSQADAMLNVGKVAKSGMLALVEGAGQFSKGVDLLETQGVQLQNAFGVSRQRMEEFKTLVADVAPSLAAIGVSETEFANTIINVTKELGGVATLSAEAITDIQAAAQVTNQDVGGLARNFREVGISMYDVGETMRDVADYAKRVGVPVSAVAENVVKNMDKINLYSFQGGVDGLTKMAAQASRLGVNMDTVFTLAEDLFSPEKAIQYSAALQRLGVTSNGLLDPLRSMDMAQNDPEALQKELVNLTKDFVRFSEENNKFEIMPGSQRRIREIANELNIPAKELTKMGIQAAEFDKKLQQLNIPDLAGDEETKELIASMAQLKDGVATLTVKNIQTGEVTYKTPDQLTASDIESLRYQEEESSKSIEQLAVDQLDQLKFMNNQLDAIRLSGMLAAPSLGTIQRLGEMGGTAMRGGARSLSTEVTTTQLRQTLSPTVRSGEDAIIAFLKGDKESLNRAYEDFGASLTNVKTEIGGMADRIVEKFDSALKNVTKPYDPVLQRMETKSDVNVNLKVQVEGNTQNLNTQQLETGMLDILKNSTPVQSTIRQVSNTSQLSMNPNK